jgi:diguanylate cyclase (GGDEF)-like protein
LIPAVEHPITVSIGVAVMPDHAGDAEGLERSADRALYTAKANGRNRVELAGNDRASELSEESGSPP